MGGLALDLGVVAAVPLVLVLALMARRRILIGAAGFEMSIRVRRGQAARGWSFGVARYEGDRLQWFRTFSAWPRASRQFYRDRLRIVRRREPTSAERAAVPAGHLVVECLDDSREVDLSMSDAALTGLLAWLEAAPPGRHLVA